MRTKNIFRAMLLLLLTFMVGACSEDDTKTVDNGRRSGDATILELLDADGQPITNLNFSLGASNYIIGVHCDGDWTATSSAEWLTLSNYAGYGFTNKNSYDKISAEKNMGEERTATVTITSGSLSRTITVVQKGASADPDDPFMTSFELVENLVMGYNLGNTLDAAADPANDWFNPAGPGDWEKYETVWGQPITTQEMINSIAAQGFNIIRVPVTWHPHVDADWNIDAAWMTRVKQVVDMVLAANCYCIINVMHDTGTNGMTPTYKAGWLYADMDSYPQQTLIYQKLWQQIATTFKDYDDHLIFESFNEILDKNSSWTAPAAGNGAYEAINRLQQDFVNVVRATGGNNRYRNLAVTTYSATGGSDVAVSSFALPNDPASNHLYLTVHSYDPYNFCNNNAGKNPDGSEYDYNQEVFDDDCKLVIDAVFSRVSKKASEVGIPFIFGEFGAIDENKAMAERIKYAKYLKQKFNQYDTTGLWWMGLYDRKEDKWYEQDIVDALLK